MIVSLRQALESDAPSLSRICLLTAAAGSSAEALHNHGELPGLVYAVPYVKLPTTFGFVIVNDETSEVVGYVLGSYNTRTFEREAEENWWPAQRAKYPVDGPGKVTGKEADEKYINLLQNTNAAPEQSIAFSPAHLHIDILPQYQRQGWGKKLIGCVVEYLKGKKVDGVWVGLDPKNENAKMFYRKLGFEDIEAPGAYMGLHFGNWRA
jgi:ribosomal protein S18 acetylase RimI-like enzyme